MEQLPTPGLHWLCWRYFRSWCAPFKTSYPLPYWSLTFLLCKHHTGDLWWMSRQGCYLSPIGATADPWIHGLHWCNFRSWGSPWKKAGRHTKYDTTKLNRCCVIFSTMRSNTSSSSVYKSKWRAKTKTKTKQNKKHTDEDIIWWQWSMSACTCTVFPRIEIIGSTSYSHLQAGRYFVKYGLQYCTHPLALAWNKSFGYTLYFRLRACQYLAIIFIFNVCLQVCNVPFV